MQMKKRDFLGLGLASALAVTVPQMVAAAEWVDYTDADPINEALAAGKIVLVDYAAAWCSVCAKQERVINALRSDNPDYDAKIVFVRVDWDDFRSAPVTRDRKIPRRSTLIVLKGDEEIGRVVGGTSQDQIKELMDAGLNAVTS
ncbi:MAG: thioredoxin family protein [Pseudomonadota bacterium]